MQEPLDASVLAPLSLELDQFVEIGFMRQTLFRCAQSQVGKAVREGIQMQVFSLTAFLLLANESREAEGHPHAYIALHAFGAQPDQQPAANQAAAAPSRYCRAAG